MFIQFIQHHAQRMSRPCGQFPIVACHGLRADRLKDLDDVEQCKPLRIHREPVPSAHPAGRVNNAEQAFRTAYESIKPTDGVFIGMFPRIKDEVRENAERVQRILRRA